MARVWSGKPHPRGETLAPPGLNFAVDPDAPVTLFPLFPLFPLGFKITSLPKAAVPYEAAHVSSVKWCPGETGSWISYVPPFPLLSLEFFGGVQLVYFTVPPVV